MNKKHFFGIALLLLGGQILTAQETRNEEKVNELEEVVVSDSRFNLKREQSGKVITKITSEELERSQGQSVATVINRVAGIEINGSDSNAGQNLGYYIRGSRNRQVVIRIDGITMTDPSASAGDFDLRLISVSDIKEIEILKGASSTLYGSGAAAAVINIKTKGASKKAISANFSTSIGSNQSQEEQDYDVNEFFNSASIHGTLGKITYQTSFNNQFTDGLSAVETENAESDPFSKFNVLAKIGYKHNDKFDVQFFGNLDQYRANFDDGGLIDGDNTADSRQLRVGSIWKYKYGNGKGSVNFTNSYAVLDRELKSNFPAIYDSKTLTYDLYNKYNFDNTFYTVIGVNGTTSDFSFQNIPFGGTSLIESISSDDATFDIIDPYLNVVYASTFGLQVNTGIRLNTHSEYGEHLVYTINPSYTYNFGENYLKGLASYSTAYITPSLFQLFDTAFASGNPDLNPEESTTIEAGIEMSHQKKALVSVVYFNREIDNFITFDPTTFVNTNASSTIEVDGIEVEIAAKFLNDKLSFNGNYTYTNIDKLEDNIRIPEHKINATVGYELAKKTYTSLSYQYSTDRLDNDFVNVDPVTFAPTSVTLEAYGILDFYISHTFTKHVTMFAGMNNITNEDYQEIIGFNTRGRNVKIGLELTF